MRKLEKQFSLESLENLIKSSILLTNYKNNILSEKTALYVGNIVTKKLRKPVDLVEKSDNLYDYIRKYTKEYFGREFEIFELDYINDLIMTYNYHKSLGDLRVFQLFLSYLNDIKDKKKISKIRSSLYRNYEISLKLGNKLPYVPESLEPIEEIIYFSKDYVLDTLFFYSSKYLRETLFS